MQTLCVANLCVFQYDNSVNNELSKQKRKKKTLKKEEATSDVFDIDIENPAIELAHQLDSSANSADEKPAPAMKSPVKKKEVQLFIYFK